MIAIVSVLVVVVVSIVITRVATIALTATGLSRELARFQARSAYTGVGFTTGEAESVVNHPVRRRIMMTLMLLGNAGIATVVATSVLGFVNVPNLERALLRLAVLAAGLGALWLLTRSRWVDRGMSRVIEGGLRRWTDLDVRDYARLLDLSGDYTVRELHVKEGDWLAQRQLEELDLIGEGVLVLGITRPTGDYMGAPTGATRIDPGDTVLLYGREAVLEELDERIAGWTGDTAHERAVEEQRQRATEEARRDERARVSRHGEEDEGESSAAG